MKDSKNIYELLNNMKIDLDDYEKEELSDVEKQNLKRTFGSGAMKKFNFKKFVSIAAALVLVAGALGQTDFGKGVYAAAESKISEITYSVGKSLDIERDIEPYANVVNQVVEDKGIAVKITDAIIDKDELILTTIFDTGREVNSFCLDYDVFINGKKINNGRSGTMGPIDESKNLYFAADYIDVKDIDTSSDIDIRIKIDEINYHLKDKEERIKGNWEFEFTANGGELNANTNVIPLEYQFAIDGIQYSLNEYRYNPVSQKIIGKINGKGRNDYDVELKGFDSLGNEVVFYLSRSSKDEMVFKYEDIKGDLSDDIESISLTPYAVKFPEESGRMNNDFKQAGEEFTIYLNN